MTKEKMFRVIGAKGEIPWELIAPHERQAQINHGQSLERLNGRGGLNPEEMVAVLEDRPWRQMNSKEAINRINELWDEFEARKKPAHDFLGRSPTGSTTDGPA